jgi:DNA-binding MarR family transcriptional regulator
MTTGSRLRQQAIDRFWETVPPLWGFIRSHIRLTATANFDITVEQFHVLRYVRRSPGSMSELAAAKNISRPAISQAADVLVRKGYVRRLGRTGDRRFVELALTAAGDHLLDAVFSETRLWMSERMQGMSSKELEAIIRAMPALKKILDQGPSAEAAS